MHAGAHPCMSHIVPCSRAAHDTSIAVVARAINAIGTVGVCVGDNTIAWRINDKLLGCKQGRVGSVFRSVGIGVLVMQGGHTASVYVATPAARSNQYMWRGLPRAMIHHSYMLQLMVLESTTLCTM